VFALNLWPEANDEADSSEEGENGHDKVDDHVDIVWDPWLEWAIANYVECFVYFGRSKEYWQKTDFLGFMSRVWLYKWSESTAKKKYFNLIPANWHKNFSRLEKQQTALVQ